MTDNDEIVSYSTVNGIWQNTLLIGVKKISQSEMILKKFTHGSHSNNMDTFINYATPADVKYNILLLYRIQYSSK